MKTAASDEWYKVHQSLITDTQMLLLKLEKALADHNHTWSDFERKLFDDISKRLHKIQTMYFRSLWEAKKK